MRQAPIIGFLALFIVPALHAELLPWVRGEKRARILALSGAVASWLIVAALTGLYWGRDDDTTLVVAHLPIAGPHALHFVVDALNAPLMLLAASLTTALVLGGPLGRFSRGNLRALLWLTALFLLSLATADLVVLSVSWALSIMPTYVLTMDSVTGGADRRQVRRAFQLYQGFGLVCFLVACGLLGYWTQPSGFVDMSLLHLDAGAVPVAARPWIFWLLSVAALVHMGITPFHSWLPLTFQRGALLPVALLVSMRGGLYVLARLALPAFPEVGHDAMPMLVAIALISALYGAVLGLGQNNLRRLLAYWVVSQSGIMLTGFVFGDEHAVSGTLLYWLGFAMATIGLSLVLAALEARAGTVEIQQLGGLVRRMPNLCACFFLFGLATIAIPGTVAFAAEDMLVHGALEAHPGLTLVMIVAMVLNAVSVVRAFTVGFLGEARPLSRVQRGSLVDLLPRERVALVSLLIALIVAGIWPAPIISAQTPAARAIAFMEQLGRAPQ
jgi:NADH-quinone oxidoreductase subunit M